MTVKLSNTVATKPNWSAAVSAVVGAVVAWLVTKWLSVDVGWVAAFTLPLSYAYHWLINEGEKKFPWLSVFFLALPANLPTPVAPTPNPVQQAPFVETNKGVYAADVNAMQKAAEVTKKPVTPAKPKPKSKRTTR